MTAVEELLRRAADVRRLFDEMLGTKPISGELPAVESLVQQLDSFCSGRGLPSGVTLFSITPPERCDVVGRWSSRDAMCAAVCCVVERERLAPPEGGLSLFSILHATLQRPNLALEIYVSFIEKRELLLDPCSIDELVGGVARESLSPDVTQCAESLGESLKRLSHRDMNTREQWQGHRDAHVIPAAQSLRMTVLRPAAASAPAGESIAVPAAVDVSATDLAMKEAEANTKAEQIAPGWFEWSDNRKGDSQAEKSDYWASRYDGIPPTDMELAVLKTAIERLRKRGVRKMKKK